MTPERSKAYGRLMRVAEADGPGALEPDERSLLRETADALLFCEDLMRDAEAGDALARMGDLAGEMVGSERWDPAFAERVLTDLEACGPAQLAGLAKRDAGWSSARTRTGRARKCSSGSLSV
jgi:hypothetical protein